MILCDFWSSSSGDGMEQHEVPPPGVADNLRRSTITIVTSVLEIASDLLDRAAEIAEIRTEPGGL